jgi:pimeloyl-ACP methyl ester carboxylesterase
VSEPIWSTGGTGGERAIVEDLEWAVGALRAAADDVGTAQRELARTRAALELGGSVGHSGGLATLSYAARNAEEDVSDTARRLAAVAEAYLEAERAARHRMGLLERGREVVEDDAGGFVWSARLAASAGALLTPVGLGLLATGHADEVLAGLPHDAPPTTAILNRDSVEGALDTPIYEALVAMISALTLMPILSLLTGWRGSLTAATVATEPARSLEDVMRRLYDTEQSGGGAVRIERWTGADGVTRRVVFIPGTEDWLGVAGNPFSARADLEVMLGETPDAARLVAEALAADGAAPGDPVMLTGHSLGGMVATGLAANPQFTKRFNVTALVTAGSPVGRIALPATVSALHLEGTRDIVPGLDGAPNPDTPTRVTVHHDARDSGLPELEGAAHSIGSAHELDTYAQTARLVDEGLGASTDAWLSEASGFLDPQGAVTVTEYRPGG